MLVLSEIASRLAWASDWPYLQFVGAMVSVGLSVATLIRIVRYYDRQR